MIRLATAKDEPAPDWLQQFDAEWILKPANFSKIIEGNYHR